MNINNITAIVWNDLQVIRRVKYRLVEAFYFPITNIIIWGLFAYASKGAALEAALIVLVVSLYWSFSLLAQQEANMLVMEDLWTSSIKHVFVAGITPIEYLLAKLTASAITSAVTATILILIANAFGAPLLIHLPLVILLTIFALLGSLALAVAITGTIIMTGREYGFLSWSALQLFVLFSAPFYSPDALPTVMRWITEIMPFTYIFEAARQLATIGSIQTPTLWHAFAIALAYFILSFPYYLWAFKKAKQSGKLARMAR